MRYAPLTKNSGLEKSLRLLVGVRVSVPYLDL
jgi:hypothetical protein